MVPAGAQRCHAGAGDPVALTDATRNVNGHGRGAALMAEVEKRLIALGCPKVQLQVRPGNEEALRFYDALGYTPFSASSTGKRLILDD
ncbi:GNAT family N-acetyltransferase [Leifsonia sp. Root112D2]|uniref:GNAT family N-acetyltransferase n=1 Tax=Leifsonia sp. Root112D2 TaxID=1736426 RepID=UPI0009E956BE|nr:GNAT family N-acetyltransferase [Leifsonia sp. Root112D2]